MKRPIVKRGILVFVVLFATGQFPDAQRSMRFSQKKQKELRILMIGDSNTEIGNITMPLKDLLDSAYGDYGTGYCTLNTNSTGRVPDSLHVQCDANWKMFDMRNDFKPMPAPYYSPDGLLISASEKGAAVTVQFSGNSIDLYYLQKPVTGNFSVAIDGIKKGLVHSNAAKYRVEKAAYKQLPSGRHIMKISVVSGDVTLLAVDAKRTNIPGDRRFVLHKWGNAWASTEEFANIDSGVFSTALKTLNPNKIVILLGTNDYNLDHRDPLDVKHNLKAIITRIKKALPFADVLVVSTFTTDGEAAKQILPKYVAVSFPQAAKETKSNYWDMNAWFGKYTPQKLPDGGVHVSEAYGKLIATELLRHLQSCCPTKVGLKSSNPLLPGAAR